MGRTDGWWSAARSLLEPDEEELGKHVADHAAAREGEDPGEDHVLGDPPVDRPGILGGAVLVLLLAAVLLPQLSGRFPKLEIAGHRITREEYLDIYRRSREGSYQPVTYPLEGGEQDGN